MSEILVLVDHADGAVRKPTFEMLTIARRLGEPSAVFIGAADKAAGAVEAVKAYGAEKVYVVDDAEIRGYLVAPKAEALAQIAGQASPAAVLITSSVEGKEIAARLAIKLDSGLVTDAVDVQSGDGGPVTTQSVFAGNYTVTGKVTHGTPIITVKPNAAAPEETPGAGTVENVAVDGLRGGQDRADHRLRAAAGLGPPRADRGRDRGVGRSWHRRRLRPGRSDGRRTRRAR